MLVMPRPRPPHLHRQTTRHGKTVWYVRIGHGPRVRLRDEYGSPEFSTAYNAAISRHLAESGRLSSTVNTIGWLISRYRASSAWTSLSARTRYQRDSILRLLEETAGRESIARVTRKAVAAGVERRANTPYMARRFRDVLRSLFKWAVKNELAASDPTIGVDLPKPSREQRQRGHAAWTLQDVELFVARWPLGSRQRLGFDILRYTGLRVGDAVMLGRQHVRDGVIRLRTQKTGGQVVIRMQRDLAESIAIGPTGALTFVANERGLAYGVGGFGNLIRDAARAAGVRKPPHGLRKFAAMAAALAGATVPELEAMFGWTDGQTAMHYIRAADRERLGLAGSAKMEMK